MAISFLIHVGSILKSVSGKSRFNLFAILIHVSH